MGKVRLGITDHVATVRNARGENYPSPLRAALFKKYGADSVTIHLREDRRHIIDQDLIEIKKIADTFKFRNGPNKANVKNCIKHVASFMSVLSLKKERKSQLREDLT